MNIGWLEISAPSLLLDVLFALPLLGGDSSLQLTTKLESAGYVDLTLQVLRKFGIKIREVRERITEAEGSASQKLKEAAPSESSDTHDTSSENYLIRYEIPGNQIYREPAGLKVGAPTGPTLLSG